MYRLLIALLFASLGCPEEKITPFPPEPAPPPSTDVSYDPQWAHYYRDLNAWQHKCCLITGHCKKRTYIIAVFAGVGTVAGEALAMLSTCKSPHGGCK